MGCRGKTWPKERDFHAKLTMGIGVELGCCFFYQGIFFQSSNQALNLNKENLNQTKFLGSFQKK
jgi:hypothetical protein